ncbi:MAG: hypothetical protein Kow00105_16520 [Phycisphaeraceae bacterium]
MAKLKQIYDYLQSLSEPGIDQAIAQALPTADEQTLGPLALMLLRRSRGSSGLSLIEQYHRLPTAVQQMVLQHTDRLARSLRLAVRQSEGTGPVNALNIIRQTADPRLADLTVDLLRHGQDSLKDEAARCLLELARLAAVPPEGSQTDRLTLPDSVRCQQSVEAVRQAVRFYPQHQRQDVLLAIFCLPLHAVSRLLAELADMGEQWVHPVGIQLTRSDTPEVLRSLIPALGIQSFHQYVVDGLGLAFETGRLPQALTNWHLLKLKRYRLAARRITNPERYIPTKDAVQQYEPVQPGRLVGLVSWAGCLSLEKASYVRYLGLFVEAPDPFARLTALRRLLEIARDEPKQAPVHHAIAGYCTDSDPGIVCTAVSHLLRCGYPDIAKVLAHLINASDERVRRIASQRLAPIAFNRLWESWPRLDHRQRLAAGRALIKIDPNFHNALHDRLATLDSSAKLRALSIITVLNLGILLEDAVIRLCHDSDLKVVSAAVKALGTIDPQRAAPILEAALDHEDERVRANAVEALGQLDIARYADRLVEMAGEQEANRARANAIQCLMQMRTEEALCALSRMLADPRPEHRVSALWLVETLGIAQVARDVAEMSISEPDPDVRKRAGRVIQQVIEQMTRPVSLAEVIDQAVDTAETAPATHQAG